MNEDERIAKPLTNGDRLRAMSNEELAEILVYSEDDEWYGRQWFSFDGDHIRNAFPTKQDAIKSTIDWLNSPAKNERLQECEIAKSQDEEESEG